MLYGEHACFVFTPGTTKDHKNLLRIINPETGMTDHCFVLIPYQNPKIKKPSPLFFSVSETHEIDIRNLLSQTLHTPIRLKSKTSRQEYIKHIRGLKEEIQRGNIYEINYCIQFVAENVNIDPWSVFLKLSELSKAPYPYLLKIEDEIILCASPELFLKKSGQQIQTKPIKGTIRRGRSAAEDETLMNTLQTSLKERTENVMAVDVARNDLSMFAAKGSVHVNQLYNIETFETVHQMVSTVSCEIREGTSFTDIINATFPMASMTGAPKWSAMQLIDETENFERKYYSGAMGFMKNEDFDLCVIIRSIFYNLQTKTLSIAVGGAITYLSDPEKEYEECLLKAGALLKALNATIED
jgi:para-aminobenzoate synthetase component 1